MIKIIEKSIDELVPYENNARINDKAVDIVANSIKEFGFKNPCIIDKDNVIVAGHTRVLACKKLGIDKVPCIVADDLTEEQIKAFRIADNSSAQIAEWDIDKLMKELDTIDYDMEKFGLAEQLAEIEKTIEKEKQAEEDDYVEPDNLETRVHLGEVWQLGRHRLMCGDSTKEQDVAKLMDGNLADLVVTDPPYNVDYEGATKDKLKIINDKMSDDNFLSFLTNSFECMKNHLKDGGVFYIWHADTEGFNFRYACKLNDLKIRECLIWNKNSMVMGRQDYQWKHEPCLYGWKDGASHYFIDSRVETTVVEDLPNINKMSKNELKDYVKELLRKEPASTIIREDKPSISEEHPTMKPVKLFAYLIKNSSRKNEIVMDLFGGSGTTIIACEQLDRQARVMELDEHYATVIVDRWEKLTGQKAVKIN